MSKLTRTLAVLAASLVFTPAVLAQTPPPPPQPGPEHAKLKEMEGAWDCVMKMGDMESKATAIYKSDLGGFWITSEFQGDFGGMKFTGRGLDGYDPMKKKYVGVWVDSMSPGAMVSEGTYDAAGKVLTMTGEGAGQDGKPAKYKMTTEHKDKDHFVFSMYMIGPDGKEVPAFTIDYRRRK
ncbi:MAG: DUF1579 domain-containing protein [Planctomycetes bacterium]|nr:DUF1579 domain-containing protein [Planctomycetota bacterium]